MYLCPVEIDIKPDSDNNTVNPNSRGVIPVAILSGEIYNSVEMINVGSLRFGPDGARTKHMGHLEDVGGDSSTDLMLHFPTRETGVSDTDTELCLTGFTIGGIPIKGCDIITIKGGKKGKEMLEADQIPEQFGLIQNYPNPFNPTTNITYNIADAGFVRLTIYSILGREVATIAQGHHAPGVYSVNFNASHLSNGTYIYVLEVNGERFMKKMIYLK